MAEREAIWLFTHRLSHSLHLHGGALHQIKILARHRDGPAAAEKQTRRYRVTPQLRRGWEKYKKAKKKKGREYVMRTLI